MADKNKHTRPKGFFEWFWFDLGLCPYCGHFTIKSWNTRKSYCEECERTWWRGSGL